MDLADPVNHVEQEIAEDPRFTAHLDRYAGIAVWEFDFYDPSTAVAIRGMTEADALKLRNHLAAARSA